ncbi:uncharacterized protein LOC107429867 [Ziziphus jujuba]|uniref:Uncharacterized protein LOC107429867 n=1 Tax=Ziziphus jujuba TaxID=326968 RepID=A0ABM3I430_ZIZJJ|nr:uncharacterized protein LOC107429867 [Ziziphus jujuba]
MRGNNGESRAVNNTLETINAAASAIASAENRVPQATVQKRRWGSCLSLYWCFGSLKSRKRIGHAVLVPETIAAGPDAPRAENPTQAPANVLPFVAPPSSPASFLQSEPPSVTQSPAGVLSLTSISANMYSPGGPASIFAIGPYAHETQLVSPPVFSTFTTEPSTAPFTPPPESVHLTTPSSPEVPFAQLLDPHIRNCEAGQRFPLSHYEFQSYQLYPGSPVGQLISPRSGISGSGTSSPFPDGEFAPGGNHFLEFQPGNPPKLLDLDKLSNFDWGSRQGSGSLTPDGAGKSTTSDGFLLNTTCSIEVLPDPQPDNRSQNDGIVVNHRVSFEIPTEDGVRCVEKNPVVLSQAMSTSLKHAAIVENEEESCKEMNGYECRVGVTSNDEPEKAPADGALEEEEGRQHHHQKHRSITLGSIKEFNFDNADGRDSRKSDIGSDWWANEKVAGKEIGPTKNWSFFPMMQPGVS